MSKKTLNLSIEEEIKERARRLAREKGISVSRYFEELIARQEDSEDFNPTPGTAAYQLSQLIPESEKTNEINYDQVKEEALKDKYGSE